MAPGFVELDDVENVRQRERAWRDYVSAARARGFAPMLDLIDAGVKPKDLDQAFAAVCEHEDVTFDMGGGEPPAFDAVLKQVERFWKALAKLKPDEFAEETKCKAQLKFDEFGSRLAAVRRSGSMARLGSLLTFWNKTSLTPKWWGTGVGRDASFGKDAKELVDDVPGGGRRSVHHAVAGVSPSARDGRARRSPRRLRTRPSPAERRQLRGPAAGDVHHAEVRRGRAPCAPAEVPLAVHRRVPGHRPHPGRDLPDARGRRAEGRGGSRRSYRAGNRGAVRCRSRESPAYTLGLRPGALFVVGDPKQSIFRFRRADIDIYNRVAKRIVDTGGEVLSLTANFRSLPEVCELANTVFPPLFAGSSPPYSPAFEKLDPVRPGSDGKQVLGVATLTVPEAEDSAATVAVEARLIASYVHAEVASKRRTYGDFLVITRLKPRLGVYAEAFDALEIPMEVSGAGLFCASAEVQVLASLLRALADPLDSVALVGVLRGPLFGLSDPELFRFRQAGGRFELNMPLPEAADAKAEKALETTYGPALSVMRQLREMLHLTRRLPLAAAIDAMLDWTGWLALAATTPGGARAGHLLQAVDKVRQIVESGGGLVDAADALSEDESSSESEALPLEPGRRNVVRLMNLHKAKGLEAPVVILADPLHTFEFPISLRVERDGSSAKGHLRLVRKNASGFGGTTLAQPIAWDAHEEEEKKYVAAERLRLLYVAGTRAKDLLVVCRSADGSQNKAWREFEGYLDRMPALKVALAKPVAGKLEVDLSAKARAAADGERAARHDRVRAASWAVATPTGEKARLAAAERAKQVAGDAAAAALDARHREPPCGRRCGVGLAAARPARARHAAWFIVSPGPRTSGAMADRGDPGSSSVHSRGARLG